ncbi:MAG: carboxypeptidase regulatory-like domain-containing protein [Bacteroidales bacterium]|nr:carboxypeptidase regulatory-like domain-containing protein [Bacteroidales bacterium]
MKKIITTLAAVLLALSAFAQSGGIKATVVNRAGRIPIPQAQVQLFKDGVQLRSVSSDADGCFVINGVDNGNYSVQVTAEGYTPVQVNVKVEEGLMRDIMFVTLSQSKIVEELDDDNFATQDLLDSGYSDSPTILFAANDVYNNIVGYGFSAIRFKNRGYNSETQDVYVAGVKMNDAITGYSPFSLWSGLNEATRSKDSTTGLLPSNFGLGGYNGITNITGIPSAVRPGWRFSVLTNSALYRLRLTASYASGMLDNGWSYAFNVSARLGGNDWVKGVFYRSFAAYAGVEKKIDDVNRVSLFAFASPGKRGAQNAATQEVYDLMHDNMYNSNWGYQNGKVRNSRVRNTFEPVIALKYDFTPSDDIKGSATLLYRTGYNGYTALDWYDAQDPRPDYYRNLPSYFLIEDEDYNRKNPEKSEWAKTMWTEPGADYENYRHLNWDRLYNVNRLQGGRSKYALEERFVNQNDVNLAANVRWNINPDFTLRGGISGKFNCTENFKKINDLLGGEYYVNVDQFAERDFAANQALVQNDLDYFLKYGEAQQIGVGQKYGYDYLAQVRRGSVWAEGEYRKGGFTAYAGLSAGYAGFWREGLVRKGLFAGLDDNGEEIYYEGVKLTTYDANGNVISSKGRSATANFFTWSAKAGAQYVFIGGHRIAANLGYFNDAPTFNQAFVSARTRNTMVDNLVPIKTFSADLTYQYSNNGYNGRITGYFSTISDQTKVMSFYDDSQQSFTNFAMTGINQRHMGIELGVKVPLPVENLSVSGVLSLGEHIYTSNPHMVQTMDNSSEVLRNESVPFWQSTPVFKTITDPDSGEKIYEQDLNGDYIITGQQKHYISGTPMVAAELALNYRINYWFFEVNGQFFGNSYLDMNPLYRTSYACKGGVDPVSGKITNPAIVEYMTAQEKFAPAFVLNLSAGKSWYIQRKYQIGFSLEARNLTNNTRIKTGGYEQTRLINSYGKDRYYRFDPKYFYMTGANYMLNIYFRF